MMLLKTFLTAAATCAALTVLSAQITVDKVNLDDRPDIRVIQLSTSPRVLVNGIFLRVDFGQKPRWGVSSEVLGPDGKRAEFNSVMDAVNLFLNNGWELFAAFSGQEDDSTFHYVLKRRAQ